MIKRNIRGCVFETNSSSTHSLVICTEDEYKKWKSGELFYHHSWKDKGFVTNDEIKALIENSGETFDDETDLREYDIYSFDEWGENYEQDETSYVTKSGEKLTIRAYFGYDG